MRSFAQRLGPARAAGMAMRALLIGTLSAGGLAACGSSPTAAPASAPGSATPAASQIPAASASLATPSSSPVPSPTAGAASPTSVPSGAGAAFDACALITVAQLSKTLGATWVQGKAMPSGGWMAGQCAWNGPSSGFFLSVGTPTSIKNFGDPAAPNAKAKLARFKAQAGAGDTPQDVPGIGDGAVLTSIGIAAYKGGTYLEMTNLGLTSDQLTKIMRLAIASL